MKKIIFLLMTVLLGVLLGNWAIADEKKEEGNVKEPKLLFKIDVGEEIKEAKELEHGEKVAVVTEKKIFVYDKKGTLQWQKNFDNYLDYYSEKVIDGWENGYIRIEDEGKILAHTSDTLYLLDDNGREKWRYKPGHQIENYAFSKEGNYLASVFIDKDGYFQLELLKVSEANVRSLWHYKLTDVPIDVASYQPREPFIINIINDSKGIVLDHTPFWVAFFDKNGRLLNKLDYADRNVATDFNEEEKLLTVVHQATLTQYDTAGKEKLIMKLPDNLSIGPAVVYYFNDKKIFYLYNSSKIPTVYLFDADGQLLVKDHDQLLLSQQVPFDDFIIGVKDGTDTVLKFTADGKLLWSKQKPPGKLMAIHSNIKLGYISIGQDNMNRYPNSPTLLIYDTEGNILWQALLGTRRAVLTYGHSDNNYLPVIIDRNIFYYYDLMAFGKRKSYEDK